MIYKFSSGTIDPNVKLGARQIRVIASDDTPDRDGDVMVAAGCVLDAYRKNPIVLASHDKSKPIGTAAVTKDVRIEALITFAPEGVSECADEFCALTKAGIINAVSIGFLPIEQQPIKQGRGWLFTKWELLEISLVAVPANSGATVIQRSLSKAGRVLSGANASKLQQAHDAAENCRALVADVLGGASDDDGDEGKSAHGRRLREIQMLQLAHPPMSDAERRRQLEMAELAAKVRAP